MYPYAINNFNIPAMLSLKSADLKKKKKNILLKEKNTDSGERTSRHFIHQVKNKNKMHNKFFSI